MKKLILRIMAVYAAGLLVPAVAQTTTNEMPDEAGPPQMQGTDESAPPEQTVTQPDDNAGDQQQTTTQDQGTPPMQFYRQRRHNRADQPATSYESYTQPSVALTPPAGTNSSPDQLRLNFDNVPLDMVLNYLSDAAGFIIIMDTQVHGNVSVISSHPLTRDEAVDLLNSVLNQNGYAAIRNGRTLTIVDKNDAKTRDIPVNTYNGDLASIPKNDEIVTEIIPVRYVDASQLVSDLSSFTSPQATIVANQAGNSIVITDTQENIRHLVEIVAAVDSSAAGETQIRVFPLRYANPNDVATELGQIFPSGGSGNQLPIRFGGGGPGGFGGGPGGFFARLAAANAGGNSDNNRAQKQSQVTAVADSRTQSVIVTASKDLMDQIAGMMDQLDVPSARDQQVYVYHMDNGDPQQALQVLQNMFQSSSSSRPGASSSSSTEESALVQRQVENATTVGQTSSSISSGTGTGIGRTGGDGATP